MAGLFKVQHWAGHIMAGMVAFGATAALAQDNSSGQGRANQNQNQQAQGQQAQNQQGQNQQAQGQQAQSQQGQQQDQNAQRQNESDQKPKKHAAQKLAVLKLTHADPQQMVSLLRSLEQPQTVTAGYRGTPPGGAAANPGQPGASGGQTENKQQEQRRPLLLAVHNQSKTLFVRGDEERLSEIQELVKALDTDGEIEAQTIGDARLVPVGRANHGEALAVLQQLQLPAASFQIGQKGVVLLRGDDEELLSQAEEVISALGQDENAEQGQEGRQNQNRENQTRGQQNSGGAGGQGGQGGNAGQSEAQGGNAGQSEAQGGNAGAAQGGAPNQ